MSVSLTLVVGWVAGGLAHSLFGEEFYHKDGKGAAASACGVVGLLILLLIALNVSRFSDVAQVIAEHQPTITATVAW